MCYWWLFGDILGTVARLFLLNPTCRNCPFIRFLGRQLILNISFWGPGGLRTVSWLFFWEIISYEFLYFLCIVQSEEDLWRFQVEAQGAYTCKQILGLCHLPHKWREMFHQPNICSTHMRHMTWHNLFKVRINRDITLINTCTYVVQCYLNREGVGMTKYSNDFKYWQ